MVHARPRRSGPMEAESLTEHAVVAGVAPASRAHAARQDRNFFTIKEIEIRAFSPLYSSKPLNGLGMNGSRPTERPRIAFDITMS